MNPVTFTIEVMEDQGVWTAVCDAIGLVTEADSYEALTQRVWEIAPELADLNGYSVQPDSLILRFEHIETSPGQAKAG